jgi:hypothetical protein
MLLFFAGAAAAPLPVMDWLSDSPPPVRTPVEMVPYF